MKTGALFRFAAQAGAFLGHAAEDDRHRLARLRRGVRPRLPDRRRPDRRDRPARGRRQGDRQGRRPRQGDAGRPPRRRRGADHARPCRRRGRRRSSNSSARAPTSSPKRRDMWRSAKIKVFAGRLAAMTPAAAPPRRPPLHRFARAVRVRPRLMTAALIGVAIALLAPGDWRLATRLLVAWDVAVGALSRPRPQPDDRRRRRRDPASGRSPRMRAASPSLSLPPPPRSPALARSSPRSASSPAAAAARSPLRSRRRRSSCRGASSTSSSRSTTPTTSTTATAPARPLDFPGDGEPDYFDFLYFAFVIGMTAQVSDVSITDKAVRRTVTAHAIVSFFFNAALLALVVNIAATAI